MVDGAELFAGLDLDEGGDGAVVGCHFEECGGEVAEGGVEGWWETVGGAAETVGLEAGVVVVAEADVLAFVALGGGRGVLVESQ